MKRKVYYVPIEPLEERYTEQWYHWFPKEFRKQGYEVEIIDGETLTDTIETGTFLDANSSVYYKSEQLKKIAKLFYEKSINYGDIFFIGDIEFSGIEAIKYLSVLNNIPIKMFGFCHAASYTNEDFMQKCEPFAKYYEDGWFNTFDLVFVGSEYHKRQILKYRNVDAQKIFVSGNPYEVPAKEKYPKFNRVILTNRPDYEKRPNLSLDIMAILKKDHPNWEFVVTTGRSQWGKGWIREKALKMEEDEIITIYEGISKIMYFDLLKNSKIMISNSIEENFGYCILEAMMFNTIPILPNDYSHPELVNDNPKCLFTNIDEQISKIETAMLFPFDVYQYAEKYAKSLELIVDRINIS